MTYPIPTPPSSAPRVGEAEVSRAMLAMGAYLRDYRLHIRRKTQDEVASAIGINRATYAKMEAGESVQLELVLRAWQYMGGLGTLVDLTCDQERMTVEMLRVMNDEARAARHRAAAERAEHDA